MGCSEPGRTPDAGSVTSIHSPANCSASAAFSKRSFFSAYAASRSCLTELSSLPRRARSSGESLPSSLLICARVPLRPSASTRASSRVSSDPADAKAASVERRRSSSFCFEHANGPLLEFGSQVFEKFNQILMAFEKGHIQGRLIVVGTLIHVGAVC